MNHLKQILTQIDGKGYKAYKTLMGSYDEGSFTLYIDHAQADPYAPPSRIRAKLKRQSTPFKKEWTETPSRLTALEDLLAREAAEAIRKLDSKKALYIDAPGQEILPRTSVVVTEQSIEFRLSVHLPAAGRRILGRQAETIFAKTIPNVIKQATQHFDSGRLDLHLKYADQHDALRQQINAQNWVAFVANGSILPRQSGISNRPMLGNSTVPFQSPSEMEVTIDIPHRDPIKGMAIPAGVTLIVGGGYHGKSTLLQAIQRGVYNHVPGDGREYVITENSAVKIRAEDGRPVEKVNISPFISNLPQQKDTTRFSTEDASGSTSQAANIVEALESGSRTLLIDEDTSATNFMIRDVRMQQLVHKDKEPITPFIDKVRPLYDEHGISTVLVVGGAGDYLAVADQVIMMDEYEPVDATERARQIAMQYTDERQVEGREPFAPSKERTVGSASFAPDARKKPTAKGLHTILLNRREIQLSSVEQLIDPSQTRAIAEILRLLPVQFLQKK